MATAYFSLVVSQLINFLKLQKLKASYFVNKFSANNFLFLKRKATFQVVFILLIFVFLTSNVDSQATKNLLSDLVRGTAKVGPEVPIKKVDDLIADISKFRGPKEAVDAELKKTGKLFDEASEIGKAARANEVMGLLRNATTKLDPSLIKKIEQLEPSSREIALILARGGEEISKSVPDLLARGQLLRNGGTETVAAVGIFGSEAAKTALRLGEAIKGGTLVLRPGTRAVTVADFGLILIREGNASWSFWNKYIQPNWKLWAGSGALAAYLVNPEYFQDKIGDITEGGVTIITDIMGAAGKGFIDGLGKGADKAGTAVAVAIKDSILSSVYAVIALLLVIIVSLSFAFKRIRCWVLWPFHWLNTTPPEITLPKPSDTPAETLPAKKDPI